jgi:hypothetical protein
LLRFFVLPSVEKRQMVFGFVKRSFNPPLSTDYEDTYIYYLLIERSFFVTVAFSVCLWASYVFQKSFNLCFFTIYVNPADLARSVGWTYWRVVSPTLFLIFLPYGWLLFRSNIDLNTYDLLHWQVRLKEDQKKRGRVLARMLVAVGVCAIMPYAAWDVPNYIIREYDTGFGKIANLPSLHTSYTFFLMTLVFLAWLFSIIPTIAVMGCAIGYQHLRCLGPRYRSNTSSSELTTNGDA